MVQNGSVTDTRKSGRSAIAEKYKDEQISKEEYDYWRYNYPKPLVEETSARLEAHRKGEQIEDVTSSSLWVKTPPDLGFNKEN